MGSTKVIQEEHSQESEEEPPQDSQEEDDENFDFGKAKMDYFKKRAKEILLGQKEPYEGKPLPLNICFKNLKNILRNPVVVHTDGESKPNYLKMTFSMCRNAVNGDRFLELSKMQKTSEGSSMVGSSKVDKFSSIFGSTRLPPLMRAGRELALEDDPKSLLLGI